MWRIGIRGQDDSFVGAVGVPTFAASGTGSSNNDHDPEPMGPQVPLAASQSSRRTVAYGLEGALDGLGPSLLVKNVLDPLACDTLIYELEHHLGGFGTFDQGKNHHGALQVVVSPELAHSIALKLSPHIDVGQVDALRRDMQQRLLLDHDSSDEDGVRLGFVGLNRRWRIYRYDNSGNETFAPHIDASFPPSGLSDDGNYLEWDISTPPDDSSNHDQQEQVTSHLTVLMYLNEDFRGGETNFYRPLVDQDHQDPTNHVLMASVRPRAGAVLMFPQGVGDEAVDYARQHWPLHEGSPLLPGSNRPKYVIRSDALFVSQRVGVDTELSGMGEEEDAQRLFRYDSVVRQAFLPQSDALNPIFLNHVASLYNPHMGVENLGPFLYSFLRFTKQQRRIVEIGAGYTSLWILQALKDNDMERGRIRELETQGQCRLLDIPWTVPPLEDDDAVSSLLCIDNCLHQKETATGALAVAQALGLDSYLSFRKGDAFEELRTLEPGSVDVLWCDFGVGSRILEFVSSGAWDSIRPGGFLLCHSSLTNRNTRAWLEKVRSRASKEETGMDPNDYAELSLLEPHKRFQNAITILQKRGAYVEPVYSQCA